jgi:hypothetical protein
MKICTTKLVRHYDTGIRVSLDLISVTLKLRIRDSLKTDINHKMSRKSGPERCSL